jgi:GntR family transcriptional regulator
VVERTTILWKGVEKASHDVAEALLLGANNDVIVIKRVRAGNGTPFIYEESHLPYDVFKDILNLDLTGSMYKIISEQFNIVLARCKQTISAVNLDAKIAKILKLPPNAAVIFLESLTFDENSVPIEMLYSYHRGDKYKLEIELGRYNRKSDKINFIAEK